MRGWLFFRVYRADRRLVGLIITALLALAGFYPVYAGYLEERSLQAISWCVANRVIVIDPGHGGFDPGCVGQEGVLEKGINLEVARRLTALLNQAGAAVVLTRDGDYDLSDPGSQAGLYQRKRDDLAARVAVAEKYRADLFVSIHVNSVPEPQWWGAQVFYPPGGRDSKRLAALIQQEMLQRLGQSYRWVQGQNFYVLRNATMPAVMVEVGFLSNPREGYLLQTAEHQTKLAWCIYAGIVRYLSGEPEPGCPF